MPVVGEPLPDDVRALLAAASRPLGWKLEAARLAEEAWGLGPSAAVVCAPGIDWPGITPPHVTPAGVQCGLMQRSLVAGVVRVVAPSIAPALEQPVEPGEVWCLVLWGARGAERAVLVPTRPMTGTRGRASA
jgi:hypothetical protein